MKKILLLLALLLPLQAALADTLKAGVSQDSWRQDVLQKLAIGDRFNRTSLPKSQYTFWVQIPKWMTGTWHVFQQQNIRAGYPITITPSERISIFGSQVDNQGNPWMKISFPKITTTKRPGDTIYAINYTLDFQNSGSAVVEMLESTNIHTDSGKITQIDKHNSRATFEQTDSNGLSITSENLSMPDTRAVMIPAKERQFILDNSQTDEFKDWLARNGHSDLIP